MKYVADTCSVELSVRELCARAFCGGDIDDRFHTSADSLHVGSEAHRKIQKEAGAFYFAEVSLSNTFMHRGVYYTVSGRADGIIRSSGKIIVDEIKSVRPFDFYAPPKEIFIAQMKCYAYFIACRDELETVCGRITYVNSENGKIKYYNYSYNIDELRCWYEGVISKVSRSAEFIKYRIETALPSLRNLTFPYEELREGQEIMIRECYSAIKRGERLFAQAPTGTGKTVSSLYPAVRAVGAEMADKVFYLTAKASTRREAYRAAGKLFEGGGKLKTVVLNAKEQMCKCGARLAGGSENLCNPVSCEFAAGYYDRAQDAIFEMLSNYSGFTGQLISQIALKYRICPYELSLDLSEYCDVIICDYNYVFDPSVYLRRYFSDGAERGKYVFLIDEAHNLADRARDMYSAVLKRSSFESIYAMIDPSEKDIEEAFGSLILEFRGLRALCKDSLVKDSDGDERGFYMAKAHPERMLSKLVDFKRKAELWLKKNGESFLKQPIEKLLSEVRRYLVISEYFDERFLFYTEISGGDCLAKIYCLDPSNIVDIIQAKAVSTVLFSATLTPSDYFVDVLGGGKKSYEISLPSPFESENLCLAIADYLSVRYEDRKKNTARYAAAIAAAVSARLGNYMVYFPSYDMLEGVAASFAQKYPQIKMIVQKKNMTSKEKEEFLDSFKDDNDEYRIGFCVLGGSFSEGVDLPGSRLIGAVIFGVGLPGISNEKNIIRDYFDVQNGCGYDYAYTFPGMNNVMQAAGRVIRRYEDRGVVVLVDDRYASDKYTKLFPNHWSEVQYAGNARSLAEIIKRFWDKT